MEFIIALLALPFAGIAGLTGIAWKRRHGISAKLTQAVMPVPQEVPRDSEVHKRRRGR